MKWRMLEDIVNSRWADPSGHILTVREIRVKENIGLDVYGDISNCKCTGLEHDSRGGLKSYADINLDGKIVLFGWERLDEF